MRHIKTKMMDLKINEAEIENVRGELNKRKELLISFSTDGHIQEEYDLESKQFKPRMISVLLSGTKEMTKRLENGLNSFYVELAAINSKSGGDILSDKEHFVLSQQLADLIQMSPLSLGSSVIPVGKI